MGAQRSGGRLAGQAAAQQRAAEKEAFEKNRTLLANLQQAGGPYPNDRYAQINIDPSQGMSGMRPMNTPDNRY